MEAIEDKIVAFMRARVETMGVVPSGALNFYVCSLERDEIYNPYERFIFDYLMTARPASVVHAGVGIGSFCAALTEAGIRCTGYEADPGRFAAAEALRDHLGLKYDLRPAFYPDDDLPKAEMLLFTNVAAGWDRAVEDRVIGTFKRFDRVVFSPRSFGRDRLEEFERAELMDRVDPKSYIAIPSPGYVYGYLDTSPRKRPRRRVY